MLQTPIRRKKKRKNCTTHLARCVRSDPQGLRFKFDLCLSNLWRVDGWEARPSALPQPPPLLLITSTYVYLYQLQMSSHRWTSASLILITLKTFLALLTFWPPWFRLDCAKLSWSRISLQQISERNHSGKKDNSSFIQNSVSMASCNLAIALNDVQVPFMSSSKFRIYPLMMMTSMITTHIDEYSYLEQLNAACV